MEKFVKGRKSVFQTISSTINPNDKVIWFHCASLGEYEQGVPIMEKVRTNFTDYKIIITFFSPSGYEIKKNSEYADCVVYLPLDTVSNAKKFINLVNPCLAIFIKYEFWPNYLFQLKNNKIPTILVSGLFRKKQVFFKSYGGFMKKALFCFNHFFVQDDISKQLLEKVNIKDVIVSGDTRFDRVNSQLKQNNTLEFISDFKQDSLCIVCGSTWPEDEAMLLNYINNSPKNTKFIIAPHETNNSRIESLANKIKVNKVKYSEKNNAILSDKKVFIIDTIGLLTKIYNYADIAYVGGGMGTTGLHNILEPATFGVPIIIGKNYKKFPEATELKKLKGLFSISNSLEFTEIIDKIIRDEKFRNASGLNSKKFIQDNQGATKIIYDYIYKLKENNTI